MKERKHAKRKKEKNHRKKRERRTKFGKGKRIFRKREI